jgi:hypothetical protein
MLLMFTHQVVDLSVFCKVVFYGEEKRGAQ